MSEGNCGGSESLVAILELELQVRHFVSAGAEPVSSARAVSTKSHLFSPERIFQSGRICSGYCFRGFRAKMVDPHTSANLMEEAECGKGALCGRQKAERLQEESTEIHIC